MPCERATRDGDPDAREEDPDREIDAAHLEDVPDGAGCTEIWEKLADRRDGDRTE